MGYKIKEPDTIRDEDAVVRVETNKGPVCLTAEKLDKQAEWRFGVVANITHDRYMAERKPSQSI